MKQRKEVKNSKVELLAPAGDMEKFYTCLHFGADAIYLAGKKYGLRAYAGNFDDEQIALACKTAHEKGVKVYVTVNVYAHESDFEGMAEYLKILENAGVDAFIVSDLGIISLIKKVTPKMDIHISTQAGITNSKAVNFLADYGAKRVVLARECSLEDIKLINQNTSAETEVFVHGAMCVSMSGRCLLSDYFTNRRSNKGECVQACRWKYVAQPTTINPVDRPNDKLDLFEDERGTYLLNSKDLNMLENLPKLIESGVSSLKIEGRMKSPYYVATVLNAYRRGIDDYYGGKSIDTKLVSDLDKASHREYTTGFYFDSADRQNFDSSRAVGEAEFIGVVVDGNLTFDSQNFSDNIDSVSDNTDSLKNNDGKYKITVEMRNRFCTGDVLEILSPDQNFNKTFQVGKIFTEKGEETDDAKIVQHRYTVFCPYKLSAGDILRRNSD